MDKEDLEDVDLPFVFYFHVAHRLDDKAINHKISYSKAKRNLQIWNIPKSLRPAILKEMEELGFLDKDGREYEIDKEAVVAAADISEMNRRAGLWS